MKDKWTPGPWEAIYNGHYFDIVTGLKPGEKRIDRHDPSIGSCQENTNYKHTSGAETEKANAQLMAAAPSMAAALSACLSDFEHFGNGGVSSETVELAKAALAKARGEDQ